MGTDIKMLAYRLTDSGPVEVRRQTGSWFDVRSYALFGFLADVRNYSGTMPISGPRGLPEWFPETDNDGEDTYTGYCDSWLTVREMLEHDYDVYTEDRRCTIGVDGGCTCSVGDGEVMTLREFLGYWYFDEIARLVNAGADVVVFWFG